MLYKRYSNAIILSLTSYCSYGSNVTAQDVIESAKASFYHKEYKQNNKESKRKECVINPRAKKSFNHEAEILHEDSDGDPDVGILSSSTPSLDCEPTEVCRVDPTSSLGGSCTSHGDARSIFRRAIQHKNRSLQTSYDGFVSSRRSFLTTWE